MPKVNREALGECWLWYPSLEEQDAILRFVEQVTGPSDVAIVRAETEISLLHEYRTRLIADVVTGKLDVREAAVRLPDETDEPEWLDEGDVMSVVDDEPVDDIDSIQEEAEA